MGALGSLLPKSVAQLTGVIVAGIVGFGTDSDLFVAIPLGVFAGSFTALCLYYWDAAPAPQRQAVRRAPAFDDSWREPRRAFGKKVSRRPAEWR